MGTHCNTKPSRLIAVQSVNRMDLTSTFCVQTIMGLMCMQSVYTVNTELYSYKVLGTWFSN